LQKLSQAFTSLEKRKLYRVGTKRLGFALMRVFIHGSLAFVIPWEILGVPLNLHKSIDLKELRREFSSPHRPIYPRGDAQPWPLEQCKRLHDIVNGLGY
jgi:hypothetical protein